MTDDEAWPDRTAAEPRDDLIMRIMQRLMAVVIVLILITLTVWSTNRLLASASSPAGFGPQDTVPLLTGIFAGLPTLGALITGAAIGVSRVLRASGEFTQKRGKGRRDEWEGRAKAIAAEYEGRAAVIRAQAEADAVTPRVDPNRYGSNQQRQLTNGDQSSSNGTGES
ncbi:hypothetical protein [Streptomyces sp. NPDC088736]|uniref:hypothetical protein n=1 Tax=Streptomyces sp. NPDC088736 TaxID=3365881 RepID=UPI0038192D6D